MNDDALLDALSRSLQAAPAEPSAAELAALHDAVAGVDGRVLSFATRRTYVSRRIVAAAVLVLIAGSAAIAAGRRHLPGPVKVVATAVGLDVDNSALDDVRSSEARLRTALAGRDPAAVRASAVGLRSRLAKLSTKDRARLGDEPGRLLTEADALVGATATTTPGAVQSPTPQPTTSTSVAAHTTTPTTVDDHRGGNRGGTVTTAPAPSSTTSTSMEDHHDGDGGGTTDGGGPGPN